jgi:hypothetical protein
MFLTRIRPVNSENGDSNSHWMIQNNELERSGHILILGTSPAFAGRGRKSTKSFSQDRWCPS